MASESSRQVLLCLIVNILLTSWINAKRSTVLDTQHIKMLTTKFDWNELLTNPFENAPRGWSQHLHVTTLDDVPAQRAWLCSYSCTLTSHIFLLLSSAFVAQPVGKPDIGSKFFLWHWIQISNKLFLEFSTTHALPL